MVRDRKKVKDTPGRPAKPDVKNRTVRLSNEDWEWCKKQPGGSRDTIERLIKEAKKAEEKRVSGVDK